MGCIRLHGLHGLHGSVGKLLLFQCFGNVFEVLGFEGIERLVVVRVHRVSEYRVVYHDDDLVSERHDNDLAKGSDVFLMGSSVLWRHNYLTHATMMCLGLNISRRHGNATSRSVGDVWFRSKTKQGRWEAKNRINVEPVVNMIAPSHLTIQIGFRPHLKAFLKPISGTNIVST
jgi:hypothetical protein